jgi:hypothetical protein
VNCVCKTPGCPIDPMVQWERVFRSACFSVLFLYFIFYN